MRKFIAGFLLCAFFVQSSLVAQARDEQSDTVVSINGITGAVATQMAADFASKLASNLSLLAVVNPGLHPVSETPMARATPIPFSQMRSIQATARVPERRSGGVLGNPPISTRLPLIPSEARKLKMPTIAPVPSGVTRAPQSRQVGAAIRTQTVTIGSQNVTGINSYWSYEEGSIPGVGKYMVNVGTGNLIVQSDDVDIPERGIDLAYRRTYNSFSGRDWNNTDGSMLPGQLGGGWTSNFDAHVANNSAGGVSVYDGDGARYDYTPNGSGCLTPPAGMYFPLCSDGRGQWMWYKKSGTIYYFNCPDLAACGLPQYTGYNGRLMQILGRNRNNTINFSYSWANGDATSANNLTQIVAQHSDGQALTLTFGNSSGQNLLSQVTLPNGSAIQYAYYSDGTLAWVWGLSNGGALTRHWYGYGANHQLQLALSPRWQNSSGTDGGYIAFGYNSSNQLYWVQQLGIANPTPSDGTSTPIQPGVATGNTVIGEQDFYYSVPWTHSVDLDGHNTWWKIDASNRVTETDSYNGTGWLITTQQWDTNNNIVASTDARGNQTNYAYDANGNTIAVSAPAVNGFNPTTLINYDSNNNVIDYCDPTVDHNTGRDWNGTGAPPYFCRSWLQAVHYSWTPTASEPFGELTDTYTPLGYHTHIAYGTGAQDFGLPLTVVGDSFTQIDGTTRAPQQTLTYDGYGNLVTYTKGNGNTQLQYDGVNRLISVTDADGVTSRRSYFPNGQLNTAQSPLQTSATAARYQYDADGNVTDEFHHFSNIESDTQKFYDGGDRLVEVLEPYDTRPFAEAYGTKWITRYIYDLSRGGSQSFEGFSATYQAHGNLAKTQELMADGRFHDLQGFASDALDRPTAKIRKAPGAATAGTISSSYDAAGQAGLLSTTQDQLGNTTSMQYDALGAPTAMSFSNVSGTSQSFNRSTTYDADGRVLTVHSTIGTERYVYDASGQLIEKDEPTDSPMPYTAPAVMTYTYYPDGSRKQLSVNSSAFNQGPLFSYVYRPDGKLSAQYFPMAGATPFSFGYSAAGRTQNVGDPVNPNAHAYSYDIGQSTSTGSLQLMTMPGGRTYNGFTYDAEGDKLGYQQVNGSAISNTYSVRGEVLATALAGTNKSQSQAANGALAPMIFCSIKCGMNNTWNVGTTLDAFNGVATDRITGYARDPDTNALVAQHQTFAFDAAGRLITTYNPPDQPQMAEHRQYDVENHITSDDAPGGRNYTWGPDGHLFQVAVTTLGPGQPSGDARLTLHWDGDTLLYTTDYFGQVNDVKVGTLADYVLGDNTKNGLTVWDRDTAGNVVAAHNATGYSNWVCPDPSLRGGAWTTNQVASAGFVGPTQFGWANNSPGTSFSENGLLYSPRTDGFSDGVNTFQGVRTYDAALGSWTTPDAYAGTVHDPMSQKSYTWNRNNPVSYSDPSGFCPHNPWAACNLFELFESPIWFLIRSLNMSSSAGVWIIGKQQEVNAYHLSAGEHKVSDRLPDLGSVHANRVANVNVIRALGEGGAIFKDLHVKDGKKIDAEPGSFLALERETLDSMGYHFDGATGTWMTLGQEQDLGEGATTTSSVTVVGGILPPRPS